VFSNVLRTHTITLYGKPRKHENECHFRRDRVILGVRHAKSGPATRKVRPPREKWSRDPKSDVRGSKSVSGGSKRGSRGRTGHFPARDPKGGHFGPGVFCTVCYDEGVPFFIVAPKMGSFRTRNVSFRPPGPLFCLLEAPATSFRAADLEK